MSAAADNEPVIDPRTTAGKLALFEQRDILHDVAVDDASGTIYVADRLNHRIQKFDASFGFLAAWGGTSGNATQNSEPSPGWLFTVTRPPCASTTAFTSTTDAIFVPQWQMKTPIRGINASPFLQTSRS